MACYWGRKNRIHAKLEFMQKHCVHFLLIIMLAVAPMQSVLAGLAALEHATACGIGTMTTSEHAGMDHSAATDKDDGKIDMQCDCCGDCLAMCTSVSKPTHSQDVSEFGVQDLTNLNNSRYTLAAGSQHPPIDIRPPIVLL